MVKLRKVLAATVFFGASLGASAADFDFQCLSNNSGVCPSLASQIDLDITQTGPSQVKFEFANLGPVGSFISQIYWQNTISPLLTNGAIINGTGVQFSFGGSPQNPGGGAGWTAGIRASADSPSPKNGVSPPTETVAFTFDFAGDFNTLLSAIGTTGQIGLHVQGIGAGGQSDWLQVTTAPIPEPETYALMLAGLGAVGFMARRRKAATSGLKAA